MVVQILDLILQWLYSDLLVLFAIGGGLVGGAGYFIGWVSLVVFAVGNDDDDGPNDGSGVVVDGWGWGKGELKRRVSVTRMFVTNYFFHCDQYIG